MSAFVITSQFVSILLWSLNVKSIWFLVSPSGNSQAQYLFCFVLVWCGVVWFGLVWFGLFFALFGGGGGGGGGGGASETVYLL